MTGTRERILDAAEGLFARDGFRETTLRSITSRAGVNLASVNYHFGSKETLIEEVFKRRLGPLNKTRKEAIDEVLEQARSKGTKPSSRDILRAFIEPTLKFKEREFITMVGRALAVPDETVKKAFMKHLGPIVRVLYDALSEARPELDKERLLWRMYFAIGAMAHTMHLKGCYKIGHVKLTADCDPESLTEMLVSFVTAGMEAP